MKKKIWLSPPHMTGLELKYINEAFASNWIAPVGPNITEFENKIQEFIGKGSHVVALNSGTAAIHLALELANIQEGDEVICQSKTFIASVNPVLYKKAIPIFIDSESNTWNLCPKLLEECIIDRIKKTGKAPKAIIVVNLYGMPYNVEEIHKIAKNYNIKVIEDSAEALGSKYKEIPCGTFGDYSIFSFNGNKIITTSGGGCLITRSILDKNEAIFLSTQAIDSGNDYTHSKIGYNYRMSNIVASIGLGQIHSLGDRITKRRENFDYYHKELSTIPEIQFQEEPLDYYSNRWLNCILVDSENSKNKISELLSQDNIETKPSWKPMHQQPLFKKSVSYVNGVSDDLFQRGICLPSGSNLDNDDLNRIVTIIKNYFNY
ncbi:aminotransferase class V-fold PLP-dependent enzyme [uncultured Lutibacter sp.]|uniref:aminotransferase class V-fold PLP-dependent enzyme n=1 Tax=uncultured Lutibacter sp. TaxID=437739 RepID=UPI00261CAF78|nr:aminotransferase class V-fold PLP-dependent enzyme [uncultured Lutibacter sp.]